MKMNLKMNLKIIRTGLGVVIIVVFILLGGVIFY